MRGDRKHTHEHIDTAHIVNIARLRHGEVVDERFRDAYAVIDECLTQRHFGLIFNMAAPLEWLEGNATLASGYQLAAVFDSARLMYHMEMDSIVYLKELFAECKRIYRRLDPPTLPLLQVHNPGTEIACAHGILARTFPWYLERPRLLPHLRDKVPPTSVVPPTAREYVAHAHSFRERHPDVCRERIDGFRDALHDSIGRVPLGHRPTSTELCEWASRLLRLDKMLTDLSPGCDAQAIITAVDPARCPAVSLWLNARAARARAGHAPKENDVDDWLFLHIVPYADMVLTDRAFRECIRQGDPTLAEREFADPNEAILMLRRWL